MSAFRAEPGGTMIVSLASSERMLLARLAEDLESLLEASEPQQNQRDPALARLLPDAYPGDPEASAEFSRFTRPELLGHKHANAAIVRELFDCDPDDPDYDSDELGDLTLSPAQAGALLRTLSDLRLTLATRLGIEADEDEGDPAPELDFSRRVYWWLGYLQEGLVTALDA